MNNNLKGDHQILIQLFYVYHQKCKGKQNDLVETYTKKKTIFPFLTSIYGTSIEFLL